MRERSGRQDVPERSGPNGLARRASAANATNESGGEAEIAGGGWGAAWGRDAEFTEPAGRLTAERRELTRGCYTLIRESERRDSKSDVAIFL